MFCLGEGLHSVGHNGSGKSNVLLGVAFAIGEVGNSTTERRLLLHVRVQGAPVRVWVFGFGGLGLRV